MSKYILHVAVGLGGTVRSFSQGAETVTCAIHSTDWLGGEILGNDRMFQKTVKGAAIAPRPVEIKSRPPEQPQYVVVTSVGDGPMKIVSLYDYAPTSEYAAAAVKLKNEWGAMKSRISVNAEFYLRGIISPRVPGFGESRMIVILHTDPDEYRPELVKIFDTAGYMMGNLSKDIGHAVVTHTTDTQFTYFDPMVGELTIPRASITDWVYSQWVSEYFSRAEGVSFAPVTVTG